MKTIYDKQCEALFKKYEVVTIDDNNVDLFLTELESFFQYKDSLNADNYAGLYFNYAYGNKVKKEYSTAIAILERGLKEYESRELYFYPQKSELYRLLGICKALENDDIGAEEAFYSHLFYLILPNTFYNNYDFYSFRSVTSHSIADLENNTLTVSPPNEFNDPLDCLIFPFFEELSKTVKDIDPNLLINAYKKIRIRCFVRNTKLPNTENPQPVSSKNIPEFLNILMWSHYANYHKGFCVKYQFPQDITSVDISNRTFTMIGNVEYKDKVTLNTQPFTLQHAFFTKARDWEYESEIRLIHYDPTFKEKFKSLTLPNDCIKGIYFGLKCAENDKKRMQDIFKGKNVDFFEMKTDEDDIYNLKYMKI